MLNGRRVGEHQAASTGNLEQRERATPDPAAQQSAAPRVGPHLVVEQLAEVIVAVLEAGIERGPVRAPIPAARNARWARARRSYVGEVGVIRAARRPAHDPAGLGLIQADPAAGHEVQQRSGVAVWLRRPASRLTTAGDSGRSASDTAAPARAARLAWPRCEQQRASQAQDHAATASLSIRVLPGGLAPGNGNGDGAM